MTTFEHFYYVLLCTNNKWGKLLERHVCKCPARHISVFLFSWRRAVVSWQLPDFNTFMQIFQFSPILYSLSRLLAFPMMHLSAFTLAYQFHSFNTVMRLFPKQLTKIPGVLSSRTTKKTNSITFSFFFLFYSHVFFEIILTHQHLEHLSLYHSTHRIDLLKIKSH